MTKDHGRQTENDLSALVVCGLSSIAHQLSSVVRRLSSSAHETTNRAPLPGSLSTTNSAPIPSARSRMMRRPIRSAGTESGSNPRPSSWIVSLTRSGRCRNLGSDLRGPGVPGDIVKSLLGDAVQADLDIERHLRLPSILTLTGTRGWPWGPRPIGGGARAGIGQGVGP